MGPNLNHDAGVHNIVKGKKAAGPITAVETSGLHQPNWRHGEAHVDEKLQNQIKCLHQFQFLLID